ncbi:MAG TPA: trimethylamine methyltransferase, partial [Chloroflexi bacterium]|nr:trimethylamine methyltransferase [Chloroflexota bacterium]
MINQDVINQKPQFRLLSDAQLEAIHNAALEILRRTGVSVHEPQALDLLKKAGADVKGDRVRIQPHLVEWAIRTAPSRVVLCDSRNGNPRLFLEDKNAYYGTGSDTIAVIDYETGERRLPLLKDISQAAQLCDALPNIDFVMSMGIASDVPEEVS